MNIINNKIDNEEEWEGWLEPLDEIRAIRDAHAAKFNYDLHAMFLDILEEDKERLENLAIKEVRYIENFTIELAFNDETKDTVDLEPCIKSQQDNAAFQALQDVEYFKTLSLNPDTGNIEWANGVSLSPAFLYNYSISQIIDSD